MPFLEVRGVSKSYADRPVLRDVDLSIERGEFVAIVGPSGSGKSTLVSLMAGLLLPDGGEVLLGGERVVGPGPDRGLVFQNYSLLPWLTVAENVGLAVDAVHPRHSREHRRHLVDKYVAMVRLAHVAHRLPAELSGGMRQRVSVARTLALDPNVLLLDEPLSALDALTRAGIQDEIAAIWQRDRKTVVLITNDVDEGLLLADRVVPLLAGPGGATLGRSVTVDLPRPRDRKATSRCPGFERLRREVLRALRPPAATAQQRPVPEVAHGAA